MINLKKSRAYIVSVIIALAAGGLSALLSRNGMKMYDTLNKPTLSPPMIVFPIVWTVLFILMGIGSAIVYESDDKSKRSALVFYALQLAVNFLWPIFFFEKGAYLFSFFWLLLLIAAVTVMIIKFFDVKPIAAYLQLPYLVWLCFAAYLNIMIYMLNL